VTTSNSHVTAPQWSRFDSGDEEWNRSVRSLLGHTPYQLSQWARHRQDLGWDSVRLVATSNGATVGMVQVMIRKVIPFVSVAWIPGGPVGDLTCINDQLRSLILDAAESPLVLIRMNVQREFDAADDDLMRSRGWEPCKHAILSGTSLMYDLSLDEEAREGLLTRNWRHNLRRGQKRNVTVSQWIEPNANEIRAVYDQMYAYKGTKHLVRQNSLESIASLITQFGNDCVVVRCEDDRGNIIALRGAIASGDRAWDILAAATPEGRKNYASYVTFWELMRLCRERGVSTYDMGGADPTHNRGVFDFKQGTGARVVRFLGEWEFSRPSLLDAIAGRRVASRAG
jgi:lipid II:glycine glycyltransferase (peptidoglycan interpeptide bridge formation enzyme)